MLPKAHKEVLDGFFAEEGIYSEVIHEYAGCNIGTKILYLERAISQDCDTFNYYLDVLYNPNPDGEQHHNNIEFIRALKVINDLCFNNNVKYGEHGLKRAQEHYLSALGEVVPEAIKTAVQLLCRALIIRIKNDDDVTAQLQKDARKDAELHISGRPGWRLMLDLPQQQLLPKIPEFMLTGVLSSKPYVVMKLVYQGYLSLHELQSLNQQLCSDILEYSDEMICLNYYINLTASHLLELDPLARKELLQQFQKAITLVTEYGVSLETLLQLSIEKLRIVLHDPISEAAMQILYPDCYSGVSFNKPTNY